MSASAAARLCLARLNSRPENEQVVTEFEHQQPGRTGIDIRHLGESARQVALAGRNQGPGAGACSRFSDRPCALAEPDQAERLLAPMRSSGREQVPIAGIPE